jgi:hypothetical protein
MKTNASREPSLSMLTTMIMHYTLPLAIVQVVGMILFAVWAFSI